MSTPEPHPAGGCGDASCDACYHLAEPLTESGQLDQPEGPDLLAGVRNGAWLDQQQFPPVKYAVPGVVPEGLSLLVGAPKIGKSWLVLGLLLAIAVGGVALGHIATGRTRRVLNMALEDGDRRQQDRCRALMAGEPIPPAYTYLTAAEPGQILPTMEAYLERYPDTSLIVLDTLGKVMPQAMPQETTYQRDYRIGGRLKAVADAHPGLAVVCVHHDRKAGSADFVETVSGSNGLAGAADTIIVLNRERQSAEGLLHVTGRDIPEGEYALTVADGKAWSLDGADLEQAAQRAQDRRATTGVSDRMADVIRLVTQRIATNPDGISAAYVAAELTISDSQARTYLHRAVDADRLQRISRGRYGPVASVASVASDDDDHENATDATLATALLEPGPWCNLCGTRRLLHPRSIEEGVCEGCRLARNLGEAA